MAIKPSLCQTWSETLKTGFLRTRLIFYFLFFTQLYQFPVIDNLLIQYFSIYSDVCLPEKSKILLVVGYLRNPNISSVFEYPKKLKYCLWLFFHVFCVCLPWFSWIQRSLSYSPCKPGVMGYACVFLSKHCLWLPTREYLNIYCSWIPVNTQIFLVVTNMFFLLFCWVLTSQRSLRGRATRFVNQGSWVWYRASPVFWMRL